MTKDATDILLKVREKITDESDLLWTSFETPDKLRFEIDQFISRLALGDKEVINDIHIHFLPTSTFQEHSIQNGWSEEYMKLAEQFDKIYEWSKIRQRFSGYTDKIGTTKKIDRILGAFLILTNLIYFIPLTIQVLKTGGGPFGYGMLLIPITIVTHLFVISGIISWTKWTENKNGLLVINSLGTIWTLFWLILFLTTSN